MQRVLSELGFTEPQWYYRSQYFAWRERQEPLRDIPGTRFSFRFKLSRPKTAVLSPQVREIYKALIDTAALGGSGSEDAPLAVIQAAHLLQVILSNPELDEREVLLESGLDLGRLKEATGRHGYSE